jgi:hypothetical protein
MVCKAWSRRMRDGETATADGIRVGGVVEEVVSGGQFHNAAGIMIATRSATSATRPGHM